MVAIGGVHTPWQFFIADGDRAGHQPAVSHRRGAADDGGQLLQPAAQHRAGPDRHLPSHQRRADHPGVRAHHRAGGLADGVPAAGFFQPVPGHPHDNHHAAAAGGHWAAAGRGAGVVGHRDNPAPRRRRPKSGTARLLGRRPCGRRRRRVGHPKRRCVRRHSGWSRWSRFST